MRKRHILAGDCPLVCVGCVQGFHADCTKVSRMAARMINESTNIVFCCDACDKKNVGMNDLGKCKAILDAGFETLMKEFALKFEILKCDLVETLNAKLCQVRA